MKRRGFTHLELLVVFAGLLMATTPGASDSISPTISLSGLAPLTASFFSLSENEPATGLSPHDNDGSSSSSRGTGQRDYFTELFDAAGDNDLDGSTLLFVPDGSSSYYRACRIPASNFPVDPTGGTQLSLGDDGFEFVAIGGGQSVSLYGSSYTSFFVNSNGNITFGSGDADLGESFDDHFRLPRISVLFDDLNPSSGGTVSWLQLSDRVVLTFENVPQFGGTDTNSFQAELYFDGKIRATLLDISAPDGLFGLSEGLGTPADFEESDISAYRPCPTSAGRVYFLEDGLDCGGSATIELADLDLQGAGSQDVTVTSARGDSETVTLIEHGLSTGVFQGVIAAETGAVAPGDGLIQVADGGEITVSYDDIDDGSGTPATVSDSIPVDCTAPVISNVDVVDIREFNATIEFTTSEPTTGEVNFGTECGMLSTTVTGTPDSTLHSIVLSGLDHFTTYAFSVTAMDPAGNVTTEDNGGSCFSFSTRQTPDYFTEWFYNPADTGGFDFIDLDWTTLFFVPDGSSNFYTLCRIPATGFPVDPAGGTQLSLGDNDFVRVDLLDGQSVSLYGSSYTSFFVGSNGYITFEAGDTERSDSLSNHFSAPRLSLVFENLRPDVRGTVSWLQLSDRVVLTFENVKGDSSISENSFQAELFFDGTIRTTHLGIDDREGLFGLSEGLGIPADYEESDISTYLALSCQGENFVTIAGNVLTPVLGGLSGVGMIGFPGSIVTDDNGDYSATMNAPFSGTVQPAPGGFTLTPESRTYVNQFDTLLDESFTALANIPPAAMFVYVQEIGTDSLFTLDVQTGVKTAVVPVNRDLAEIEWSPDGKRLYATTESFSLLLVINAFTGNVLKAVSHDVGTIHGLAFDQSGNLLGTAVFPGSRESSLVRINTETGALTIIGPTGRNAIGGLAFDATYSTLYGIIQDKEPPSVLVEVNTSTGKATPLVETTMPYVAASLEFTPDGRLFAGAERFGQLYTLDPTTGVATYYTGVANANLTGLSFPSGASGMPGDPMMPIASDSILALILLLALCGIYGLKRSRPGVGRAKK